MSDKVNIEVEEELSKDGVVQVVPDLSTFEKIVQLEAGPLQYVGCSEIVVPEIPSSILENWDSLVTEPNSIRLLKERYGRSVTLMLGGITPPTLEVIGDGVPIFVNKYYVETFIIQFVPYDEDEEYYIIEDVVSTGDHRVASLAMLSYNLVGLIVSEKVLDSMDRNNSLHGVINNWEGMQ